MMTNDPLKNTSPISGGLENEAVKHQEPISKETSTSSKDTAPVKVAVSTLKQSSKEQQVEHRQIDPRSISNGTSVKRTKMEAFKELFGFFNEPQSLKDAESSTDQVQKQLNEIRKMNDQAGKVERSFSDRYPSEETIKKHTDFLTQSRGKLAEAETPLQKAKQSLAEVEREIAKLDPKDRAKAIEYLTEKHTELTAKITGLESQIKHLEGRIAVTEQIIHLEQTMKNYKDEKGSWDSFKEMGKARIALGDTLKGVISQSPRSEELLRDLKNQSLSAQEIYTLIKRTYAGLQGHIERLFDATLAISDRRIKKLEYTAEFLKGSIAAYNKKAKEIKNLEEKLYGNSISSHFHRMLFSVNKTKAALAEAQEEIRAIHTRMTEINNRLEPEEIEWLARMGQLDASNTALKTEINTISEEIRQLDVQQDAKEAITSHREAVTNQVEALFALLEAAKANKIAYTRNQSPILKNSVSGLESEIKNHIRELTKILPNALEHITIQKDRLPSNFEKLELLDQMKALIPLVNPNLESKNKTLFKLIADLQLKETLKPVVEAASNEKADEKAQQPVQRVDVENQLVPSHLGQQRVIREQEAIPEEDVLDLEDQEEPSGLQTQERDNSTGSLHTRQDQTDSFRPPLPPRKEENNLSSTVQKDNVQLENVVSHPENSLLTSKNYSSVVNTEPEAKIEEEETSPLLKALKSSKANLKKKEERNVKEKTPKKEETLKDTLQNAMSDRRTKIEDAEPVEEEDDSGFDDEFGHQETATSSKTQSPVAPTAPPKVDTNKTPTRPLQQNVKQESEIGGPPPPPTPPPAPELNMNSQQTPSVNKQLKNKKEENLEDAIRNTKLRKPDSPKRENTTETPPSPGIEETFTKALKNRQQILKDKESKKTEPEDEDDPHKWD